MVYLLCNQYDKMKILWFTGGTSLYANKNTYNGGGWVASLQQALINNPKILFADEPTGNLDTKTTKEIMELLTSTVKEKGQTLVMVTHDLEVASYADRIIHMVDGVITNEEKKGGNVANG